ncbi:zinc-binding dehydrogenase [Corallococcus sp. BB11-1]|uniref:zinc-binding dehydrogenase n=1 Tax=Corallococcus sp. BB11-1 TaxID=2996783 RepID=UPI00226EB07C|nr:zinc-binding dehydrogenase [Corallococcus sp. BB11-1]
MGLNIIQGAVTAGAERIIVVDVHPKKLELAKVFGATDVKVRDPVAAIRELTHGRGADSDDEAVGRKETLEHMQELSTDAPQDSAKRWDKATGGSGSSGVLAPDEDSVVDPDRVDEGVGGSDFTEQGSNSLSDHSASAKPSTPNAGTPGNKGAKMEVKPLAWDENKEIGSPVKPLHAPPAGGRQRGQLTRKRLEPPGRVVTAGRSMA